jgi:hypothetical protein
VYGVNDGKGGEVQLKPNITPLEAIQLVVEAYDLPHMIFATDRGEQQALLMPPQLWAEVAQALRPLTKSKADLGSTLRVH